MNKRICSRCGNEYVPTGKRQKRCGPCGLIHDAAQKKVDNRKSWEKNKEHRKKGSRFRKYDLTEDQYNELFAGQGGACAICGTHQQDLDKALAIDHCHTTLEVRGLLCSACNLMLGIANDKIEILMAAIEYLKRTKRC